MDVVLKSANIWFEYSFVDCKIQLNHYKIIANEQKDDYVILLSPKLDIRRSCK